MPYHGRHRPPTSQDRPTSRRRRPHLPVGRPLLAAGLSIGLGVGILTYATATDQTIGETFVASDSRLARGDQSQQAQALRGANALADRSSSAVSRTDRRTALAGPDARAAAEADAKERAEAAAKAKAARAAAAAKAKAAAEARRKAAAEQQRQQQIARAKQNPKAVARSLMAKHGWTSKAQYRCLVTLWNGESDWRWSATNPTSGAYGIPQSLPASKMARFGNDWRTNPITQITWGLWYIDMSYGSPCKALDFWNSKYPHWY